ncbi:MAG: acyl carrier protein [Chloroflexi bacterium]|nr:acyl carrier protein [Chloroflexota bacterium]
MASTADRIKALVSENLEVDGQSVGPVNDLNTSLSDLGVSSVDIVAFGRLVVNEFGISMSAEDCADIPTLADLVKFVDGQSG